MPNVDSFTPVVNANTEGTSNTEVFCTATTDDDFDNHDPVLHGCGGGHRLPEMEYAVSNTRNRDESFSIALYAALSP